MPQYTTVQVGLIAAGGVIGVSFLFLVVLRFLGPCLCPTGVRDKIPRRFQPFLGYYTGDYHCDPRSTSSFHPSISIENPNYERFEQPKRKLTEGSDTPDGRLTGSFEIIIDPSSFKRESSVFERFVTDN